MTSIDPDLFSISRPTLDGYRAFVQPGLIVETYQSSAGAMRSKGAMHRISINRTAHRRYAYRFESDRFKSVDRPPLTLGFQPADMALDVDGDAAEYISIFQSPDLYERIGGPAFDPRQFDVEALSTTVDPVTFQVANALAVSLDGAEQPDAMMMEHLSIALACGIVGLLTGKRPQDRSTQPPMKFKRVLDYIETALSKADLSIDEMARIAHMSPFHFTRQFKRATGMTPHQFVLWRRIERARIYLSDRRESIAAIADLTGFSSQAHFTSTFRRMTGSTPNDYRKTRHL